MKPILLCTFGHEKDIKILVDYIQKNYVLEKNKIFIFENQNSRDEIFCTYNVRQILTDAENTILIHRKKESNTLYTINALNALVKKINNGILDKTYQVDWELYQNSILLFQNEDVNIIPIKLKMTVDV